MRDVRSTIHLSAFRLFYRTGQLISKRQSLGESNAVFLRGVGGDAAREPHKTGCSDYPEEEFSGTHMDLKASIFKPGETIRRGAHDGEGGRSTVTIGRVRLVGCGEPEPQEGGRSTVRIGNDSEVIFPIMAGAKQSPIAHIPK